jgi:MtN3 and saliva related transmembrane protein
MYALSVVGFALWMLDGVLQTDWPIIATNVVCLILSGFILSMKLLSQPKKEAVADAIENGLPL